MQNSVVIDCSECRLRVNAQIRGAVHDGESGGAVVLASCPSCKSPLVGQTGLYQDEQGDWRYEQAERVWPAPASVEVSVAVPESARKDIKDAQKCIAHGIYSAAAVLCGRALERLVKEKATGKTLADGLADLKAKGIIDERLSLWATALRQERNIGAHAGDSDVSKENAQDVLDFTVAIFEYVYTLSEKYADFIARKAARKGGA